MTAEKQSNSDILNSHSPVERRKKSRRRQVAMGLVAVTAAGVAAAGVMGNGHSADNQNETSSVSASPNTQPSPETSNATSLDHLNTAPSKEVVQQVVETPLYIENNTPTTEGAFEATAKAGEYMNAFLNSGELADPTDELATLSESSFADGAEMIENIYGPDDVRTGEGVDLDLAWNERVSYAKEFVKNPTMTATYRIKPTEADVQVTRDANGSPSWVIPVEITRTTADDTSLDAADHERDEVGTVTLSTYRTGETGEDLAWYISAETLQATDDGIDAPTS